MPGILAETASHGFPLARMHALEGDIAEAEALRVDLEGFLRMFRQHEEPGWADRSRCSMSL